MAADLAACWPAGACPAGRALYPLDRGRHSSVIRRNLSGLAAHVNRSAVRRCCIGSLLDCDRNAPTTCLLPASDAAAYLFSELARLGSLEARLFVDDEQFKNRDKLSPDPEVKLRFTEEITAADRLADLALQKAGNDTNALFVKGLNYGLRANYAALIDKQSLAALSYTREGRPFAERLLAADPAAFDAYLGPGVENYLLSLKTAPVRFLLRMSGSETDRARGMEELRKTAQHGYYLEPFAKLLLAVAALRDDQRDRAAALLTELHNRFPDNELTRRELSRIAAGKP